MADTKLVQQIVNGKVPETTTSESAKAKNTAKETKDMFLQLLVAEMKYQDPMEPTDNSEYVKELATFTQVESIQGMQTNVTTLTANALTGKYVVLNADNGGIEGYVDYVKTDTSGSKVSIDGKLYDASAVESVLDETYHTAITAKKTLAEMVADLPAAEKLTVKDHYKKVVALNTLYSSLDAYQKSMISAEDQKTVEKLIKRMDELVEAAKAIEKEKEEAAGNANTNTGTEGTEGTTTQG